MVVSYLLGGVFGALFYRRYLIACIMAEAEAEAEEE